MASNLTCEVVNMSSLHHIIQDKAKEKKAQNDLMMSECTLNAAGMLKESARCTPEECKRCSWNYWNKEREKVRKNGN